MAGPWLPEELGRRGYETWAASCNSWISMWGGFDRGFDRFLDLQDPIRLPRGRFGKLVRRGGRLAGKVDHGGRRATTEFERRLAAQGSAPLFAFVNLMEVHSPFNPPGSYYPYPPWRRARTLRQSGASKGDRPFLMYSLGMADPGPGYAHSMRELYYSCARYEDALLGSFLEAIEGRGRPTVVVMVSDHGENLGEDGLFGHNTSLGQTVLHVPLAVWGSKFQVEAGWVEEPVSLLGMADWLLRIADSGGDGHLAGGEAVVSEYESSAKFIPASVWRRIESEGVEVPPLARQAGLAVRKDRFKYLALENGREALYDVEDDPHEERDLRSQQPDRAAEFASLTEAWMRRRADQPRYAVGEVADEEMTDHLRELGYIE